MTQDEKRIVAEAIRLNKFTRNGRANSFDPEMIDANELSEAESAITALDAHRVKQGLVLVPVEPTKSMLSYSGCMRNYFADADTPDKDHIDWWKTMIQASQETSE